jgi:hypothetical protein
MASRAKKPGTSERSTRQRCQVLVENLGCLIEREHMGYGSYTWWVYGPEEVYGFANTEPERTDPCEGDHACAGWIEVEYKLLDYALDLAFHAASIDSTVTSRILEEADQGMLASVIQSGGDKNHWLVLADWFLDQQKDDLAATIQMCASRLYLASSAMARKS